jgi:hypothetical protein
LLKSSKININITSNNLYYFIIWSLLNIICKFNNFSFCLFSCINTIWKCRFWLIWKLFYNFLAEFVYFLFSIEGKTINKISNIELCAFWYDIFYFFAFDKMSISNQIKQILLFNVKSFSFIFFLSLLKKANSFIFN